jgi:hypothetical protein
VNEYYISSKDNFKRGTLTFPFEGLTAGPHSITLKVWDNHNNPATASIDFVVSDTNGIVVQELFNYPNPFSSSTVIQFIHSRPGDDLDVALTIFNLTGQVVQTMTFSVVESQYQVSLTEWDGSDARGTKLTGGIYLIKVLVRSVADGSKNEQFAKLIILN